MARYRPIGEQISIAIRETAAELQQIVVDTAKAEHGRVMRTEPRPRSFFRYVDGREGAVEEDVGPFGVIHYEYPRLDLVAEYALQVLKERSPHGPPEEGHYKDAHQLYVGGALASNASAWRPGQEIWIVNAKPYARKIEVGAMVMMLPGTDHVYAQAQQIVRRLYGALASIRFTFKGAQPVLVIAERRG